MPRFENSVLSVDLPSDWIDESDEEVLSFVSPDRREEVTISLGQFREPLGAEQLGQIVWHLVEAKAKALGQISGGGFEIIDVAKPPSACPYSAMFSGIDKNSSTFSKTVVTGHSHHFLSVSYYNRDCAQYSPETATLADAALAACRDKAVV